jgi:hypothetical protein
LYTNREEDPREIRKAMSGFQNWVGKIRGEEFGFFINSVVPEKIFTKLSLLRTSESETQYHAQNIKKYLYSEGGSGNRSKRKKETLIEVIMAECNSIVEAHESIIDYMVGSMANKIPSGEEKGISIGDVSFVGCGKNLFSITFARNNIMAIVRSVGDRDVDIKSFAKKLDDFLLSKDKRVKSKNSPIISTFNLSTQQMTSGGMVNILFNAIDPRDKYLMLKLFTTAGPISMSDNNLILECKKLGNHKVEFYAINRDLLASGTKLDLIIV